MNSLINLRDKLLKENLELIKSISFRKELVRSIHQVKMEKYLNAYDIKRELEVFNLIKSDLKRLTLNELFSFSLIMEDQVRCINKFYPAWSMQEHLDIKTNQFTDGTNPLLLAIFYKESYDKLKINSRLQENINELL